MGARPEDLADALVRRRRMERDRQRQRAGAILGKLPSALAPGLRTGRIHAAWLIGSLTAGTFGAGSDVDVVVEGLSAEDQGPFGAELTEALGAEVDLLRLEDLPEGFRGRVLAEGTPIRVA